MNSNYNNKSTSGSLNNFNFDFGIGSNRPRSLNDQKNQTSYSSSTTTQSKPSWQSNKPSWTHQPAPSQPSLSSGFNGPTFMVGDKSGKSWNSGSGIGIVDKNPSLFGDLVNSALGQGNKGGISNSNVPLKNVAPVSSGSAFSMGSMANSLPKTGNAVKSGASWSYNGSTNVSGNASSNGIGGGIGNAYSTRNKSSNIGGPSMNSMASGSGVGGGSRDPFGSLVDFGSKQQSSSLDSANKSSVKTSPGGGDDAFGVFQNAAKSSTTAFPSGGFGVNNNDFMGSNASSNSNRDDFGIFNQDFTSQRHTTPAQKTTSDPLENIFFPSSSGGAATASGGAGGQQFTEVHDWGLESDFGGGVSDDLGGGPGTTELEGVPPPPAGVTASAAKSKGLDNQKQGQYADAIKWLSWAVVLFEKTGDKASTVEILSTRASCYKEVGEYKKAVADCTKVLEGDDSNVSVLVQRALLYESMEKYKLGAEDLRTVLKIDPTNRIARSTVHRLTKMID